MASRNPPSPHGGATFHDQTVAGREARERAAYANLRPRIAAVCAANEELPIAAEKIAQESDLDIQTVFRWLQLAESFYDRRRRRLSYVVAGTMWFAVLGAIALAVLAMTDILSVRHTAFYVLASATTVSAGLAIRQTATLRRRVYAVLPE